MHALTHTFRNSKPISKLQIYFSHQFIVQQTVERRRKMLQGVQFAIHVSYLCELRAESAGVDIANSPPPLSKCVERGKVVQTSAV